MTEETKGGFFASKHRMAELLYAIKNGGNITVAARVLGVSPNTVKKHLGRARIIRAKCRSSDSDERSLKSDG